MVCIPRQRRDIQTRYVLTHSICFCIPRQRRDMSKAKGIYLISIRGFAKYISQNANISSLSGWGSPKRRMSFGGSQRSESISSSSFVNIFHESEYIDIKKNKSKNKRRKSFYSCSFCLCRGSPKRSMSFGGSRIWVWA